MAEMEPVLREALASIAEEAGRIWADARDEGNWTLMSTVEPIRDEAAGALVQPMSFADWCARLNAHHEHLRKTEDGFEGYGDGPVTEQTGAECWLTYYADGFSPEDALAEDRTYWGD